MGRARRERTKLERRAAREFDDSRPTGICNCSALPLWGTDYPAEIGRLVIYYPHAIGIILPVRK